MQTVGSGSRRTVTGVWSSGRKRDEPLALFTNPSRPGRLMEVTACQDLHETPRTQLGLPERPEARPGPRPAVESVIWAAGFPFRVTMIPFCTNLVNFIYFARDDHRDGHLLHPQK